MGDRKKPELLSPAGSLEKLKFAVTYGADAVYFGGKGFSLRAAAEDLVIEEVKEGVDFAHNRGVKVYAALNIVAHERDFDNLISYVDELRRCNIDAVIVSDLGIFKVIKDTFPRMPVFISVQANITNSHAVSFWKELGAKRVTLARELSFSEIKKVVGTADIGTEIFVHGAMCIAYSGRCLLSKYLADRDANQGECAHCCRWKYFLLEEKRENDYYPILEDGKGTYIFSSKDLCLLGVLPELISSGVSSLKIEGRMKSPHYVSVVTKVYRDAIDRYFEDPGSFQIDPVWEEELQKISHREYTEGFVTEQPAKESSPSYIKGADFVGVVRDSQIDKGLLFIEVRNRIYDREMLEAFLPTGKSQEVMVRDLRRATDGAKLEAAHANYFVHVSSSPLPEFSILRRVKR